MLPTDEAAGRHDSTLDAQFQVGTYSWWPRKDRLDWSPALLKLYGLSETPTAEAGFTRLLHPEDRVRVESETSAFLGSEASTYSHTFRIVRPDGSVRFILDRGAIERDATGGARVLRGMNVDLTDLPELDRARRLDAVSDRLKQSEARLDAALRAGRLGVHELDLRTGALVWDTTVCRIWGVAPGEPVTLDTFTAGVHPEDLPAVEAAVAAALDPDGPGRYEASYRVVHRRTKDVRWVRADGDVTFEGRTPVRLVGTVQDISERREAEERRRESEARYRLLHESLRDAFVQVDMAGRIRDCNEVYCDLVGYSRAELEATTYVDLTPPRWREFEATIVEQQILTRGYSDVYEKEYRRKDGSVVPVELRTVLVTDRHGEPASMWAIVRDITPRKKWEAALATSEARLRRSEQRFRHALANSPITVFEHDTELRYQWIFNSKLGYSDTFAIGKTDEEIMEPAAAEVLTAFKRRVLETGQADRREVMAAAPGQPFEYFDLHVHPRCDETGRVIGLTGVATDITERKRAQEALDRTEAQLRRAARAAVFGVHEFDPSRQEAWWSPEMARILGVAADGPITLETLLATTHPLDRDRVRAEMAAIQRRIGPYEIECRVALPDGGLRWILDRGEAVGPIDPVSGLVARVTGTVIDITERKVAEERLRAAHDTFRHLVDRSPFGIYAVDADFRLVQVSDGAQKVFSNVRPLIGRDFAEVLRTIWPEPFATEAIGHFHHTLATGETYHAPTTVERRADIASTEAYDWKLERIMLPDNRPGVVCHFYDLSERQRHEEHVKLLMLEVNHRAKNMLALIQAMVRLTAPAGAEDFVLGFGDRLQALAAAQTLLVSNDWRAVPLADLVRSQLSHFSDLIDTRIAITGPEISLSPAAAQALGLALHELATNAAKHGALSTDAGRVEVAWGVGGGGDGVLRFSMAWEERGGPPVRPPQRHGFGSEVTTTMARMSLGGEVEVDYAAEGLRWSVACPLRNIGEDRAARVGTGAMSGAAADRG